MIDTVRFAFSVELVGLKTVSERVIVCPCVAVEGELSRTVGVDGIEPVIANETVALCDPAS